LALFGQFGQSHPSVSLERWALQRLRGLTQQALGFAPKAVSQAKHARQVLQMGGSGLGLLRSLQA
jgi:hypothetical protein